MFRDAALEDLIDAFRVMPGLVPGIHAVTGRVPFKTATCARRRHGALRTTAIGVGRAFAPPPSEPCVRFSRTRLSSRWFPHRGCLAPVRAVLCVNGPNLAKAGVGPPLTPLPSADIMRSVPERRFDPLALTGYPSRTSPPRLAAGNIGGRGASLQSSRIQLPASLPIGAVLLAAPLTAQKRLRYHMKALTPAALTLRGGSLRSLRLAFPPFRSQPRVPSEGRFLSRLSALGHSRLRHHPAGSPRVHAESNSCSYGLAVRLRLLPTPAHADAVTFGYMVTTLHDGDLHPADKTSSQTHWMAGTSPAMTARAERQSKAQALSPKQRSAC